MDQTASSQPSMNQKAIGINLPASGVKTPVYIIPPEKKKSLYVTGA
jgi:hypothetical protein